MPQIDVELTPGSAGGAPAAAAVAGADKVLMVQGGEIVIGTADQLKTFALTLTDALEFAPAVTLASAATTDIGGAASNYVAITGFETITSLGTTSPAAVRFVRFVNNLILTHNASTLILPGGKNIVTAANDSAIFVSSVSGFWRCLSYFRNAQPPSVGQQWQVLKSYGAALSHTGNTTETTLATVTVPGGALGPNGVIRIWVTVSGPNSANNKTLRVKFDGNAALTATFTTVVSDTLQRDIANRNSASSQVCSFAAGSTSSFGTNTTALTTLTVDTTIDKNITFTVQLGDGAETIVIERYAVEICYGA